MKTTNTINELIKARNNGDKTAQAKIDVLFAEHRNETEDCRNKEVKSLSESNAIAYAN